MFVTLGTTPTVQRTMTFDQLRPGAVLRAKSVRDFASGKAINAARVLHTLGHPVTCLGVVGGDRGRMLRGDLDAIGLAHDFVEVPQKTRLCVTVIDERNRQATELIEEPAELDPDATEGVLATLDRHLAGTTAVVLSGSLAAGVPSDFYGQCVTRCGLRTTIVDGRGLALLQCLPSRPTVVKLNVEELGLTFGRTLESRSALRLAMAEVCDLGARWCVITRGASGAAITNGEDYWDLITPRIDAVSPVGSGDAFAAGLALRLSEGDGVPEACAYGAACGAANALRPDAGTLEPVDVDRLLEQVTVRPAS